MDYVNIERERERDKERGRKRERDKMLCNIQGSSICRESVQGPYSNTMGIRLRSPSQIESKPRGPVH